MSVDFTCGSEQAQAALAAYLYQECTPAERAAIESHVAVCAACAAELASLGATRSALASWTPPDTELGFRIVSEREEAAASAAVLRPARWWRQPLPAWAQAAAAVLIFAAGGLLGMRAATGNTVTAPPAAAIATAPAAAPASGVSAQDLAALEQRLRREIAAARETTAPAVPVAARATMSDDQIIERVRALLVESEERQQREMSIRLAQVLRDVDVQRRMDLARIEDTFGQMQGLTGVELQQQREAINYLRRVSLQRPQ